MNAIVKTGPASLGQLLASKKKQIAMALPNHLKADRLLRVVMTEVGKNPDLKLCDPQTVVAAVIQSAQLGLEPGSHLGHSYLLPFNNRKKGTKDCQFIIGYRGMIELARRTGQVQSISARCVYEGDEFEYSFGLEEKLNHVPGDKDDGDLTFAYVVVRFKGGGHQFEVMSCKEIDAVRRKSKAGNFGPWVDHFAEMAKKTVIRRMFKYLPISVDLQRAVMLDELADAGVSQGGEEAIFVESQVTEEDASTSIDQLNNSAAGKPEPKTVPQESVPESDPHRIK